MCVCFVGVHIYVCVKGRYITLLMCFFCTPWRMVLDYLDPTVHVLFYIKSIRPEGWRLNVSVTQHVDLTKSSVLLIAHCLS